MKRTIVALSIAALTLTTIATPTFAKEGKSNDGDDNRGLKLGKVIERIEHKIDLKGENQIDASKFVLTGTVSSKTASSLVVTVKTTVHVPSINNGLVTVNVNADTKITANSKDLVKLDDVKVGDQVIAMGSVSGTTLTATRIHVNTPKNKEEKKKVFGEVTAKTTTNGTTSVTVKNNVTGATETVTVNEDTKVTINGEAKTVTDIKVGDSGWVKVRNQAGVWFAKVINLFR